MARKPSPGKCQVCGESFDKAKMTVHLRKCLAGQAPAASATKAGKLFHVLVEGACAPEYWLHLELPATASLLVLDGFLRDIWLECCGHCSMFRIGETMYSGDGDLELEAESMRVPLGKVLSPGTKFVYEYDFGTTTPLNLKVVGEREGPAPGKKGEAVRLLARNLPPEIPCHCGAPATDVCAQCLYDGEGWLCKKCSASHKCGEEMLLPVVNSPRVGQCAYAGGTDE